MRNKLGSLALSAALIVVASMVPPKAGAQSIARRVSQVRDGRIWFTFASRPDICGYGNSISRGNNTRMNWSSDHSPDVAYDEECSHSPVRIVLIVDDGKIAKLRTYVGGQWRTDVPNVTNLGAVSVREATDYLLSLAANDPGAVGRDAIMPVTLADSVTPWSALFRIARDDNRPSQTKKQAIFWLGQAASEKIAPEGRLSKREDDDEEVKKSAVFAVSQRRNGEAVPALLQIARNNKNPEVRKSAMFWLGQTGDPRAIDLFEQILR